MEEMRATPLFAVSRQHPTPPEPVREPVHVCSVPFGKATLLWHHAVGLALRFYDTQQKAASGCPETVMSAI